MEFVKEQTEKTSVNPTEIKIVEGKVEQFLHEARYEQNLSAAILWGTLAAIVGAIIWALITAAIQVQIGWMAVGVGFLVGFTIRKFGKGFDKIFGYAGAGLSLFGCILGNLLTIVILISTEYDISLFEILLNLEFGLIIELMKETFHPMDIIFYGIAIYEGYKFSFRQLTEKEITDISSKPPNQQINPTA